MVTPWKPPSPYEQLLPLPTPCFKTFLERSLNDLHPPPPHFKHPSLLPPSPFTTPSPPPKNFDRTLAGFDWTLLSQSIMGSPVIESTSSCPGHLSGVPTVLQSTSSCPKYLRLSRVPLGVESTSICREHLQLSKVPPVVQSTSSCREYLQLSRASPVVQSTSICREHLQLSKVPPAVESTISRKYLR